MDGLIFGLVDNGLVLAGTYCGVNIDGWLSKRLGKKTNPVLGAVLGGTGTNLFSDAGGCYLDPTMNGMLLGVFVGCLIPMLFIPLIERVRNKISDDEGHTDDDWF